MGSGDRHAPLLEHADAILGGVLHVHIYGENQGRVRRCAVSNRSDAGKRGPVSTSIIPYDTVCGGSPS